MSNLGNRSLLEAIAFPIAIENIMRGRLRGYYFNTFLLLAEQCARTLQHARWVAASLPATRELSPGARRCWDRGSAVGPGSPRLAPAAATISEPCSPRAGGCSQPQPPDSAVGSSCQLLSSSTLLAQRLPARSYPDPGRGQHGEKH